MRHRSTTAVALDRAGPENRGVDVRMRWAARGWQASLGHRSARHETRAIAGRDGLGDRITENGGRAVEGEGPRVALRALWARWPRWPPRSRPAPGGRGRDVTMWLGQPLDVIRQGRPASPAGVPLIPGFPLARVGAQRPAFRVFAELFDNRYRVLTRRSRANGPRAVAGCARFGGLRARSGKGCPVTMIWFSRRLP